MKIRKTPYNVASHLARRPKYFLNFKEVLGLRPRVSSRREIKLEGRCGTTDHHTLGTLGYSYTLKQRTKGTNSIQFVRTVMPAVVPPPSSSP